MPEIVRAALVQQAWTGDKDSMTAAAVAHIATAASAGAQVVCLQELFYGPYFCQVQDADYYAYTEAIPDGPTTRLLQDRRPAAPHRDHRADVRGGAARACTTTPRRSSTPTGLYLGKYRKNHLPQVKGFWEKFYFRPGNLGYPVFDTAVGRIGVYICYDRHFPEGWRALGLAGAQIVFNPSATSARALVLPVEAGAARRRGRQRVLRRRDQPGRRRAARRQRLLRPVLLRRPARPARRRRRLGQRRRGCGARPRHGQAHRGQGPVAVLPGPPPGAYERW